jgi:arsenate reductase
MCLQSAARDLHAKYRGVFGTETIESLLFASYDQLAATATVHNWLVTGAERYARQRLEALAHARSRDPGKVPSVLFLCVHNAGRSQMALGWFTHLAGNKAVAWSGGSEPAGAVNPAAVAAMAEAGIDITGEFPKPWAEEFVQAADVVVTMGCGDACPLLPGKQYEDWELDDPPARPSSRSGPSATRSATGSPTCSSGSPSSDLRGRAARSPHGRTGRMARDAPPPCQRCGEQAAQQVDGPDAEDADGQAAEGHLDGVTQRRVREELEPLRQSRGQQES